MAGFINVYSLGGGRALVYDFVMKDTETLTVGDLLNLESGEVDLAANNDTTMLGPLVSALDPGDNIAGSPGTISGTSSVTRVKAVTNFDVVLADGADANARVVGVNLDLTGATGAQGVTTDTQSDFFVVKDSAASEDTLVKIAEGEHYLQQT